MSPTYLLIRLDRIKCSSYTGQGSTDTTVDTGFKPGWVMIKSAGFSGSDW